MSYKIKNPKTNHWVSLHTTKGTDILGTYLSGGGDKNWSELVAKDRPARREQANKCKRKGKACFLQKTFTTTGLPLYKYPVCSKGSCEQSCDGLRAAKVRAAQWRHEGPKMRAQCFANKKGCDWSRRDDKTNAQVVRKCDDLCNC